MGTAAPPSELIQFSTDTLPERYRIENFSDVFGRQIAKCHFEHLPPVRFFNKSTLWKLPGLGFAKMTSAGFRAVRTPKMLVDGTDSVVLTINTQGTAHMTQRGRETSLVPSSGVPVLSGEASIVEYPERSKFILIHMPRETVASAVTDLEERLMRPLPQSEALRLLISYATGLSDQSLRSLELQQTIATHLADLMALAIGAKRDVAETAQVRGLRAARLNTIKGDIVARFSNEGLSVANIAQRHRVTPRYVQMMFEADGTTFTEFLIEQRLLRAHELLLEPGCTISSIAYTVGFSNLSYFNRAFRRRFGMTPSDVRAEISRRN